MSNLDPRLRHIVPQSDRPAEVEVLIRGRHPDALQKARAAGLIIHFALPGPFPVASGTATFETLERLAQLYEVSRIEASRSLLADLEISRDETQASAVHKQNPPVCGRDVLVGILDSGIDYSHPDFRHNDGSSRILFLWDQGGTVVREGSSVPYGREYMKSEIDEALASTAPLPTEDREGHGTHVAGIAAGNGRAEKEQKFTGIAPEADLIIVALRSEQGASLGRSVRAFDAFSYIVERAGNRPVAINLSQGMNSGGHSGETLLETGIDQLARRAGVVVVKSSGNEQEWRTHAGGQIAEGQLIELHLQVPTNDQQEGLLEVWFDGSDQISVALQPPGCPSLSFIQAGEQTFNTLAGNQVTVDFDPNMDETGDTLATIILSRGSKVFIQPGVWKLLLRGERIENGRYDVWIERTRYDPGEQIRFSDASADPTRTVSIPGTARRVITVGSFITSWDPGANLLPGQISSFSSRGPTRYGLEKPDLTAPGEIITSARASQSKAFPDPDELYTRLRGTSMAAPHVTGAAALLLSINPRFTCEQIQQILRRTARRDGLTTSAPDNIWGAGKLHIQAAIDLARRVQFPRISDVRVEGAIVSWRTDIPTTGAVRFSFSQRQLQLGKRPASRADLTFGIEHRLELTGLAPGLYYCEVWAFSSQNWSTAEDKGGEFFSVQVT